jgi:signal transduction histidine kinase
LQALNKRLEHFGEDDLELLEIVSGLSATSIMNFRLASEAQLAAVARAVGDLGHDIKNSLTPIETTLETTVDLFIVPLFEDIDALDPNAVASIEEFQAQTLDAVAPLRDWYPEMQAAVRDGCGDIREMVSEIADYIKGAQATNMQRADIGAVISEKLRRLNTLAQNRRLKIHLEGLEGLPTFAFDPRLVGRAVYNLVNNGLSAINDAVKKKELEFRSAGYNIWVRLSAVSEGAFPEGGFCLIEVQDDGPGIPDRVLESLFTPRTISTTPGGTGIGTRFVKSVADAHGGEVGVESELGQGARFWMKLPLQQKVTLD